MVKKVNNILCTGFKMATTLKMYISDSMYEHCDISFYILLALLPNSDVKLICTCMIQQKCQKLSYRNSNIHSVENQKLFLLIENIS